ncbi:MAG: FAD binding domain-containing protein [Planctomycetota bacterium]|jgi:4-hydroxybenzoyl-CoA reductase subunit beta
MMRLPPFRYLVPKTAAEAARMLRDEGPSAMLVAGGTDLYPNMKRRHQTPETVITLRNLAEVRGIEWSDDGSLRIGPMVTLRALERDERLAGELPGLREAVLSISTPVLRNMGTIGGNLCLDTRCNYYNQNYEWRRAIDFCMKCEGETCWTAPGSEICWAVNSSDTVPVMIALGATVTLLSADGEREVSAEDLYQGPDGIEWMTRRPDEVMTSIRIPPQGDARSVYRKLRRRGTFDFPVLGVAARVEMNGDVTKADVILNAIGPLPVRCEAAEEALVGGALDDEAIEKAAKLAQKAAKPLDNTDFMPQWRRKMVPVFVKRALASLR